MPKTYVSHTVTGSLDEIVSHLRWCRANLGNRGSDWDFSGGYLPTVIIYSEKIGMFYLLRHPDAKVS